MVGRSKELSQLTAAVAVISRALAGPMKREGYSPPFIAAIIAAASTIAASSTTHPMSSTSRASSSTSTSYGRPACPRCGRCCAKGG